MDSAERTRIAGTYTIGDAAQRTGIGPHALRYYERVGLLRPIVRDGNGHRRYSGGDLAWVRFLIVLRGTGMPIREMRVFVELERAGVSTVGERQSLLEAHRAAVDRRILELKRDRGAIDAKIAHYRGVSSTCVEP